MRYRRPANYMSVKMKTGARGNSREAVSKLVLNLHAFNVCANYLNLSAIEIVPAIVSVALCEKPCSCSCTSNMEKS